MKYILAGFMVLLSFFLSAQESLIKNADKKYKSQLYNNAIELYEKAYHNDPDSYYVLKRLVLANQKINNTQEAEKWMQILIEKGRTVPADLLLYAELLIENGNFDKAREYLIKYAGQRPDDTKVTELHNILNQIETIVSDSTAFEIKEVSINTPGAELGTCFFDNGIIFSSTSLSGSNRDNKLSEDELPFLDLYFSEEIAAGQPGPPRPFAPKLKTRFNDGPVSYDPVENLMYITRYAPNEANNESNSFMLHLQIIIAKNINGDWEMKEEFFMNNPDFSVSHPAISHDGKFIYFASDMPGGYGGSDLYFCYKNNNSEWSEPFNLGPVVNSAKDEFFPFIDHSGKLYFSSNGHPGLGGQDVFIASTEGGVFKSTRNLGSPVNSSKDDVAFTLAPTSDRGYFSSNRTNSLGYYDIYSIKLNSIPVKIRGIVKDVNSKSPLAETEINFVDTSGKTISSTITNSSGSFSIFLNKRPTIRLEARKQGYATIQKTVGLESVNPDEELMLEIFLQKK